VGVDQLKGIARGYKIKGRESKRRKEMKISRIRISGGGKGRELRKKKPNDASQIVLRAESDGKKSGKSSQPTT